MICVDQNFPLHNIWVLAEGEQIQRIVAAGVLKKTALRQAVFSQPRVVKGVPWNAQQPYRTRTPWRNESYLGKTEAMHQALLFAAFVC